MILNGDGRFILLDKPASFPHTEVITRTSEGPVFDLSVDLEYFNGVVYVKAEHVIEMANVLGMSTKEETEEMRATISRLEQENKTVPDNVKALLDGIDNVVSNWTSGIVSPTVALSNLGIQIDSKASDSDDRQGTSEESAGSNKSDGIDSDKPADGPNKAVIKAGHPSVGKGPNKFSAGPANGFGFDN